jgi:superfamily II DNA or RNA helicase
MTGSSPICCSSMTRTDGRWSRWPLLLAEQLRSVPEPLLLALEPGPAAEPAAVVRRAARALLDLPDAPPPDLPGWLAAHQVPAVVRLTAMLARHGGAVLADAVGLGKSYVALAVAAATGDPFALVVPAVLVPQWRRLLTEFKHDVPVLTHESLSVAPVQRSDGPTVRLYLVDEAHRFRNPETLRYRALARMVVGARVLLVTATPIHNRLADLFHLFRLFLRDDALTALGIGSLARAARGALDAAAPAGVAGVAARLLVSRSRGRAAVRAPGFATFPQRAPGMVVRAGAAPHAIVADLTTGIAGLGLGGPAAPLVRLNLLRRLASSLPALRASLERCGALVDLAREAARSGRRLAPGDFARLFPRQEGADLQLTLLPLLLEEGASVVGTGDAAALARLVTVARCADDPKAEALVELLRGRGGKTVVFADARETVGYLLRRLHRQRAAAVTGAAGRFGRARVPAREVLAAFAPHAQRAAPPPRALETDVLIATDLVSEGLNLQDAVRVVHYDLPWSPARLAQRVGRIDRLGSPHEHIETVSFLPPEPLAAALDLERRLAAKLGDQQRGGAAQAEAPSGVVGGAGRLDWCDRLQDAAAGAAAAPSCWATVRSDRAAVVLLIRFGDAVEVLVVEEGAARADPDRATTLLESGCGATALEPDRPALNAALALAAPVVRRRIAALAAARWRADDRDRVARRLIPLVLTAGRRAARAGDARQLAHCDALVTRLTLGMTAGEELSLHQLVERRASLGVRDLVAWHDALPPLTPAPPADGIALEAAIVFSPPAA